jgi:hypothetical protein
MNRKRLDGDASGCDGIVAYSEPRRRRSVIPASTVVSSEGYRREAAAIEGMERVRVLRDVAPGL